MPGVPKSQACKNCKARKVRCDLNWPTCGRCKRADRECPGPSTMFKWIEESTAFNWIDESSSSGSSPPADEASTPLTANQSPSQLVAPKKSASASIVNKRPNPVSIVAINSRSLRGGGSYGLFRLSSGPRAPPTTSADRLAAQLIRHLEGPQKEILRNISYFECIPNRLSLSSALRDAVALFCCAWHHVQRGVSAVDLSKHLADPYIKAIRSVRKAVSDPHDQLRAETLAATSVLERFDVLFNANRQMHNTVHTQGICSLLLKKGPPDLSDDLDMRLCIEGQSILLPFWVAQGGENFYLRKEWSDAIDASRDKLTQSDHLGYINRNFGMDRIADHWPSVVHELHKIKANLNEPGSKDSINALLDRLGGLLGEIEDLCGDVVERAGEPESLIKIVESAACPGGYAYDFEKGTAFALLAAYLLFKLLYSRMTLDLLALARRPIDRWSDELSHLCRHLCMLGPYLHSLGPIACTLFSGVYYFVYALGTDEEMEFALQFIVDTDRFMHRLPKDPDQLRERIMLTYAGMVGQVRFEEIKQKLRAKRDSKYSYVEGDLEL